MSEDQTEAVLESEWMELCERVQAENPTPSQMKALTKPLTGYLAVGLAVAMKVVLHNRFGGIGLIVFIASALCYHWSCCLLYRAVAQEAKTPALKKRAGERLRLSTVFAVLQTVLVGYVATAMIVAMD